MNKLMRQKIINVCNAKIDKKGQNVGLSFYAFFANKNNNPELLMEVAKWWILKHKLNHFEKATKIKEMVGSNLQNVIMLPRIEHVKEKKFIGKRLNMSLANNKTRQLWKSFMPFRNEIKNNLNTELVSLQIYNQALKIGDFNQKFEKWALVEVTNFDTIPATMETFVLKSGLYAVFNYKGLNTDPGVFKYILDVWLPNSGYLLDNRPHFEVLGEKYKNGDPDSEEDIWIPIKKEASVVS